MKLNKEQFKTPGGKITAFRRYQAGHCAACGACAGPRDAEASRMCFTAWLESETEAEDTERYAAEQKRKADEDAFKARYPHLKFGGDLTHPHVHPTDALVLDNRAVNALRRNKIETMDQLVRLGEEDFLAMPGLGIKSIRLILNALTDYERYDDDHS